MNNGGTFRQNRSFADEGTCGENAGNLRFGTQPLDISVKDEVDVFVLSTLARDDRFRIVGLDRIVKQQLQLVMAGIVEIGLEIPVGETPGVILIALDQHVDGTEGAPEPIAFSSGVCSRSVCAKMIFSEGRP